MGAYACEPPVLHSVQAAQILGVATSTIETYSKASKGSQAAGYELSNRGEQVTDVYTIDFQALHEPHVP